MTTNGYRPSNTQQRLEARTRLVRGKRSNASDWPFAILVASISAFLVVTIIASV